MINKIIRLESISLMDYDDNLTTRIIEVGRPYDEPKLREAWDGSSKKYNLVEHHSDRDVVSIDFIRDQSDNCYMVRLKDGNELCLPMNAFISEAKEVADDEQ